MMFRRELTKEQIKAQYPSIFAESESETLSDRYLYIPTYKIIEGMEQNGFKVVGAKQVGTRKAGSAEHAKHVVYMSPTSDVYSKHLVAGTHNRINEELPMIALTNSHNGGSSFQLDTAFFRLVCSNGLLMPTTTLNSARIVHKIGMEADVINAATRIVSGFETQVLQINAMKEVKLSQDERVLLSDSAARIAFEAEQLELNKNLGLDIPSKLLRARRSADTGLDLWSTFNVIQENIIKGGLRVISENDKGQRSIRATRAVNSIDRDSKLNKELMTLAQKFAELKGAA